MPERKILINAQPSDLVESLDPSKHAVVTLTVATRKGDELACRRVTAAVYSIYRSDTLDLWMWEGVQVGEFECLDEEKTTNLLSGKRLVRGHLPFFPDTRNFYLEEIE